MQLSPLGKKILLDRYALKDTHRETLAQGDTVLVITNKDTGQREIGTITKIDRPLNRIEVDLTEQSSTIWAMIDDVDKPTETSPEEIFDRVALAVAKTEKDIEYWHGQFYHAMYDFKFVPAGRILAAAGNPGELTYFNCYVLPSPIDSRSGIFSRLSEMAEIMSRGGGVGLNLSSLRPKKAYVKGVNGRSSGAVSWGSLFSNVTGLIEQGGSRRGALMLILNDWHPDILEFIQSKKTAGKITNANISVAVSDELMAAVELDGNWTLRFPDTSDPDYDDIWTGSLESWENMGKKVIDYGTYKASYIWNAIVESAHASAEPGIWFNDRSESASNSSYFNRLVATNPCITGDCLIETTEGKIAIADLVGKEPYVYAMNDGKLTIKKAHDVRKTQENTRIIEVHMPKGTLKLTPEHRVFVRGKGWVEAQNLKPKDTLVRLQRIKKSESYLRVKLSTEDTYTPEHRFVLSHFEDITGFDVHHANENTLDNRASNLEVKTHEDHSVISNSNHEDWGSRDDENGQYLPKANKKKKDYVKWENVDKGAATVLKITEAGFADVYNMEVEDVHNFVANGVVVHNCGEQPLPAWSVCNLGAINLAKFYIEDGQVDWYELGRIIQVAVRFLDDVIDATPYFYEENEIQQKYERRIGLNTMGLAELLIKCGIRYGSEESIEFIDTLYEFIVEQAYRASAEIAGIKGSFPAFDKEQFLQSGYAQTLPFTAKQAIEIYGLRNVTLLTQAPNGTIGTMVGTSTGIEPFFSFKWTRKSRLGTHEEWLELAKPYADGELPDYFVTAMDLTPTEHVQVQATIQRWVDSAISKTVNMPASATVEDVAEVYQLMHRLGCKGGTVYRDNSRDDQVLRAVTYGKKITTDLDMDLRVQIMGPVLREMAAHHSTCPECHEQSLQHESGCETCISCGYSLCKM